MAQQVIIFEDWTSGDSGRARPDGDDAKSFRGVNVWQYIPGIGPRPAFQALGITGLPSQKAATFNVLRTEAGQRNLVWAFDATPSPVYWSDLAFAAAAATPGSLTNKPIKGINAGNFIDWVSPDGFGGHITVAGGSFGDKAAMLAGRCISFHGEQQVLGGNGANAGQLLWSELHDTTVWPAPNFEYVGFGQTIQAIYSQRNTLLVCTLGGDLWLVTGVLGVNETLRKVDTTIPHADLGTGDGAVANQSRVWWTAGLHMVHFTGAQALLVPRPDLPKVTGYAWQPWYVHPGHVVPLQGQDEVMVVGTMDGATTASDKTVWAQVFRPNVGAGVHYDASGQLSYAGGWTRHAIPVANFTNPADSSVTAEAVRVNQEYTADGVYISTSSSTAAPAAYVFNPRQEFPLVPVGTVNGVTVNAVNDADSGVPTVATFQTAEVWHPAAGQYTVQSVLVDYSFNPNFAPSSTYNKFDLSVEALQNPGSDSTFTSTVQTFVAPRSGSTPDGPPIVRGQAQFQVGDQGAGVGFRVHLDDWRGIMVHRITVVLDDQPGLF